MPPFYANSQTAAPKQRTVVFVVYPGIVLLDLVGPLQVFTRARHNGTDLPAYVTHVVSLDGGPVETNTIVQIDSAPLSEFLIEPDGPELDTLVIVGGNGAEVAAESALLVKKVNQLAKRARRACSICCGAFVLAATKLLDGRRAVTHWEDCDLLASRFPEVCVEVDPIFINDGPFWTSAGITAGIDMALAIVQEDLGRAPALQLARSLVTPMIRSAGQSQYSSDLARQTQDLDGEFSALHDWLRENLSRPISVEDMAVRCAMSSRSFSRRYLASIGVSPAKSLERMRVDAAKNLLLETDRSMKTIAIECGFRDSEKLRRAFHRNLHTSPSSYQSLFRDN
ncbi:GlxA family transcriptional regulator [Roseovarius sp. EL26]|uniref:GlxA family transcriptional regulator n=1 Tax=Roseovarius sp. EL26 TaxID=2126672 RepID=UPI0020B1739A|nr:helix-turn-helix domain-containing protein [Roseovarius sp. EL26]